MLSDCDAYSHFLRCCMSAQIDHILPDVIGPDLYLLICGSAAGIRSATVQAYYAGHGNLFWRALYQTGLTPTLVKPPMFRSLLKHRIGLTDVAKKPAGSDRTLSSDAYDSHSLTEKLDKFSPLILAFNGKTPAQHFLQRNVHYGQQEEYYRKIAIFVLPSTSGAARRYWSIQPWQDLARLLRKEHSFP